MSGACVLAGLDPMGLVSSSLHSVLDPLQSGGGSHTGQHLPLISTELVCPAKQTGYEVCSGVSVTASWKISKYILSEGSDLSNGFFSWQFVMFGGKDFSVPGWNKDQNHPRESQGLD